MPKKLFDFLGKRSGLICFVLTVERGFAANLRTGRAITGGFPRRARRAVALAVRCTVFFSLEGFSWDKSSKPKAWQGRPAVAAFAARPRSAARRAYAREREQFSSSKAACSPCAQKVVRLFGQAAWADKNGHL